MKLDSPTLPKFESVEELIDFFDSNDMGDYIESMPEVEFDVLILDHSVTE